MKGCLLIFSNVVKWNFLYLRCFHELLIRNNEQIHEIVDISFHDIQCNLWIRYRNESEILTALLILWKISFEIKNFTKVDIIEYRFY